MKKTRFSITPYEKYSMLGMSENAFNVIDYVTDALKKEKLDVLVIPFQKKAIDGNHDNLMTIAQRYLDMANNAARKRKAEKFSRKYFAELADVNEAEAGILKAIHDAFMENKVDMLEGLEIDGHSLSLKAQGNRYYIGEVYPDLWNIIKNTDLSSIDFAQEVAAGLKDLPQMLKKYLQNKYNMMLINDFVGIDFTDDVSQAVNFNIEPLVKVNFDKLSKEWWNEFSKSNKEGVGKAAYKATKAVMKPQEMFEILTLEPDMFDGFELVKAISDNTQTYTAENTEYVYVNKATGEQENNERDIYKSTLAYILAEEYAEDSPDYVTEEEYHSDKCTNLRNKINNQLDELYTEKDRLGAEWLKTKDKKRKTQLNKEIKALVEQIKDLKDDGMTRYSVVEEIMDNHWEEKEIKEISPMSINVLMDANAYSMEQPYDYEKDYWEPTLGYFFGALEKPQAYKSSLLEICCDDIQNNTALFF